MFTKTSYSCLVPGIHGSKQENNMLFKKYIEIGGVTCSELGLLFQDPGKFPTILCPTWITIYSKKILLPSHHFFSISALKKHYILVIKNWWRFTSGFHHFELEDTFTIPKNLKKYSHSCIYSLIYSPKVYWVLLKCQEHLNVRSPETRKQKEPLPLGSMQSNGRHNMLTARS